jgi:anti-sigma regulatory factor (Ser/Thr protein kinase)
MSDVRLSLPLTSKRSEVPRLADAVEAFGREQGFVEDDIHSVQLLLDEIVINIIKHGYKDDPGHPIDVTLTLAGKLLTIRVEDEARPFNPTTAPAPNLDLPIEERPIGGLGVHIVKSLTDSMEYQRVGSRNILTMTKTLQS